MDNRARLIASAWIAMPASTGKGYMFEVGGNSGYAGCEIISPFEQTTMAGIYDAALCSSSGCVGWLDLICGIHAGFEMLGFLGEPLLFKRLGKVFLMPPAALRGVAFEKAPQSFCLLPQGCAGGRFPGGQIRFHRRKRITISF